MKKALFHYEAAAMAGNEVARFKLGKKGHRNLGNLEAVAGNMDRAVEHWTIAASTGDYHAMHTLRTLFEGDSTLTAYSKSCAKMRSEARDTFIRIMTETD